MLLKHTNYAPNSSNYAHEKVTNYAILMGNSFFGLDPELIMNHGHFVLIVGIFVSCSSGHELTT